MKFVVKWVFRELLNDRQFFSLFVACMVLGIFGLSILMLFRDSLDAHLQGKARQILSADFAVTARREILPDELKKIETVLNPLSRAHVREFFSMVSSPKGSRLVQVRVVDQHYPLAGELRLASGLSLNRVGSSGLQLQSQETLIYPELTETLELKTGDFLRLGSLDFRIRDIVIEDSTQTFRLATLAPKLFIPEESLKATGLLKFGSTTSDGYFYLVGDRTPEALERLKIRLEKLVSDPQVQFLTPYDAGQDSSRVLQYVLDYLGLVAMTALALAIVGMAYLVNMALSRRLETLALLKSLGLPSRKTDLYFYIQIFVMGLFSSASALTGLMISRPWWKRLALEALGLELSFSFSWLTILTPVFVSTVIPLFLSTPYLRALRRVSVREILSEKTLPSLKPTLFEFIWWVPVVVLLGAFAVSVTHSYQLTIYFFLGLIGAITAMLFFAMSLVKVLPAGGPWSVRHSILRFKRLFRKQAVVVIALTSAALLVTLIGQVRSGLQQDFSVVENVTLPDFFVFDIQDNQISDFKKMIDEGRSVCVSPSPLIRARLLKVNDIDFERNMTTEGFKTREQEAEFRMRNRGLNLTVRNQPSSAEAIVKGAPFDKTTPGLTQASVEVRYAERMGLKLGDRLEFDIQGVSLLAVVKNLRAVKWNRFEPNFFINLQSGPIDEAPKTWIAGVAKIPPELRSRLESTLIESFPNISMVDVTRVIKRLLEVTDQVTLALNLMAGATLLVGFFLFIVIFVIEFDQRSREIGLFRIFGAVNLSLRQMLLQEILMLSIVSCSIGVLISSGISYLILRLVFGVDWVFDVQLVVSVEVVTFALALFVGIFWTQRILKQNEASLLNEG